MTYTYRTIIDKDTDGTYRGFVPALHGCQTWGWTSIDIARDKLREAMDMYIRALLDSHEVIPQDNGIESIETISMNFAHA